MFVSTTGYKKLIGLTLMMTFLTMVSIKAFSLPSGPPTKVEEAFKQQFPTVSDVKWEEKDKNFIANFKAHNTLVKVIFDSLGNQLESEKEISVQELPEKVVLYFKTQDEDAKIIKVHMIEKTSKHTVLYDVVAKVNSKKSTYTISKDGYLTSRR